MTKKRLIAICYTGGRCGTSLTMGLLQLSGVAVGSIGKVKDHNNARGYYEINTFLNYYNFVMPELKGFMPMVKNVQENIELAKKHRYDFSTRVDDWLPGDFIAVKCPYYLPMFLFPENYQITVISLRRDLDSQAKSIEHLNINKGDFKQWLKDWQVKIDKYFKHDIEIWFEEWINEPYKTYLRLCEVVKPPKILTEQEINEFIDPGLKHY